MSLLFRAVLVIGVLSFLALQRQDATPAMEAIGALPAAASATLPAAWNALPAETRQRLARESAAEVARQLAAMPRSQDTLGAMDRRPDWRGVASRP